MQTEEKRGAFIAFEWKKIVLPIVLILFFSYQIYVFYSASNVIEKHLCTAHELSRKIEAFREQNNTEQLNQTISEWQLEAEEFKYSLKKLTGSRWIIRVSQIINPFFPFPCELSPRKYCRYYISRESFDCMYNINANSVLGSLSEVSKPEYKKISPFLLVFHLIIIFIVGYLISAIVLFIFRKDKIKRRHKPPTTRDSKSE